MMKMFKPYYLNNYRDKADKHLTTNKHYLFILLYKNYELLFKRYESSGGGANFSLCPPPPPQMTAIYVEWKMTKVFWRPSQFQKRIIQRGITDQ